MAAPAEGLEAADLAVEDSAAVKVAEMEAVDLAAEG